MSVDSASVSPIRENYDEQWKALSAWFLGPRAENNEVFMELFKDIFERHVRMRDNSFPSDPAYITEEMKNSHAYRSEIEHMREELVKMQQDMEGSFPFFSPQDQWNQGQWNQGHWNQGNWNQSYGHMHQGHMNWDISMPAMLGHMMALLFNQNNIDPAASPVTASFEQQVGEQLCDMLGYNVFPDKNEQPLAWGHVTSGGDLANIEALWASRNMKYMPLAVRAYLLNSDPKDGPLSFLSQAQIDEGLKTTVLVYKKESNKREAIALKDCSNWQLLNVDIDEICDLVESVTKKMGVVEGCAEESKFHEFVKQEGVMTLGLFNFMKKHGLKQSPVYTAPANYHYSWSKAGTLLNLGSNALIPIQLDVNFRQNVAELKVRLQEKLDSEIPVIAVVAVMGSTEESAVDPIKEMYDLREEFKVKGLNFALLSDAAWGGYFKTMLIESSGAEKDLAREKLGKGSYKIRSDNYVQYGELSPYVQNQYKHIQLSDAITIDPHNSGFCPYPGGALCYRNGKMRYPLAHFHPYSDHHHHNDQQGHHDHHDRQSRHDHHGHHGIEGSKPGAASAGILMSHNVIGLSKNGYGRILGQCTATSKLFYSMWLTMAREDDPFICVPLQPFPTGYDLESAKKLIKEKIAFKPMVKIYEDKAAKDFLRDCGPDTTINTFVVNFKNNKDVKEANKLQVALAKAMNEFVGTDARRIPVMMMQYGLDAKKHGEGLKDFKKRAGLAEDEENMNVVINTCMKPWQKNESIFAMREQFRMVVLNCIGRVKDAAVTHRFNLSAPCVDNSKDESIFIEYMTCTDIPEHQYQVSVKVESISDSEKKTLVNYINKCAAKGVPVLFETVPLNADKEDEVQVSNLHKILNDDRRLHVKLSNDEDNSVITFKVLDIPRYQRLDLSATVTYPEKQKYFIYGDSNRTIMSHVISKLPDFQHTVRLSGRPHSMTDTMLELGVMVELDEVEGVPLEVGGGMKQPLQRPRYEIAFKGEMQATSNTTANIKETVIFNSIISPSA